VYKRITGFRNPVPITEDQLARHQHLTNISPTSHQHVAGLTLPVYEEKHAIILIWNGMPMDTHRVESELTSASHVGWRTVPCQIKPTALAMRLHSESTS
jgi:hypothetical protein